MRIPIKVKSVEFEHLGMDSEVQTVDFEFRTDKFVGYWLAEGEVMVVVGAETYTCPYSRALVAKLKDLVSPPNIG